MGPPERRNPQGRAGGSGYDAKASNLPQQYSRHRVHCSVAWIPTVCRSFAVAQQPCDLSRSLAVAALCAEMRAALEVRP